MKLEEVLDIVRRKRRAVVSTVGDSGGPEVALTERNEILSDTLGSSRKAVNLGRRAAAALVIGLDNDITVQIEGDARRPRGDHLAYVKGAYCREWPDGRARENWPDIAYVVVRPRWMRYANYAGAPVIEEFTF
jgi:hypothetical protein